MPARTKSTSVVKNVKEIAGKGLSAEINGRKVLVGNGKLMAAENVEYHDCHKVGTVVHVAVNGKYFGHIVISDVVKPDSEKAIRELKGDGCKTVMLTGDRKEVAEQVGKTSVLTKFTPSFSLTERWKSWNRS